MDARNSVTGEIIFKDNFGQAVAGIVQVEPIFIFFLFIFYCMYTHWHISLCVCTTGCSKQCLSKIFLSVFSAFAWNFTSKFINLFSHPRRT